MDDTKPGWNRSWLDLPLLRFEFDSMNYLAPLWVAKEKEKKNILSADNWHVYTFVKLQVTSFIFSDLSILTWHMFCKNNVQKSINSLYECERIL